MSINRVDVQGTFIRQDASQIKHEEDNRAYADMTRLSAQFAQESEENHIAVSATQTLEAREEKYDASEEGKNKHLLQNGGGRGKRSSKKPDNGLRPDPDGDIIGPDGRPLIGGKHSAFDLKI